MDYLPMIAVFPGTFEQALNSPYIKAGDELLLKAGTYSGDFISLLVGELGNPTVVKALSGERVVIDGNLDVNTPYVQFWGIEFTFSGWTSRLSQEAGSTPSDVPMKRVYTAQPNVDFINCVFHNMRSPALYGNVGLLYGCISFHHGWKAPDRSHGHTYYVHNSIPTKTIKDCISFFSFGWGFHLYAEGGDVDYIDMIGCTSFCNGIAGQTHPNFLQGGEVPTRPRWTANMSYMPPYSVQKNIVGYVYDAIDIEMRDNYFPEGITINGNLVVDEGNYYGPAIGNKVFLRPNEYDPKRANLTIYNQAGADTIEVDVSAIYANSTPVQARNVQDYYADIQNLTVASGKIAVNMQAINRTVATPVQWTAPATTFPQFGCFVLQGS